MASCSTSSLQRANIVSKLLRRKRPCVFSVLEGDYVFGDFESLAEKDKKLRVFIQPSEARERAESPVKKLLHEKAKKAGSSKVLLFESLRFLEIGELEYRSFMFKLWLRRINSTRHEDKEKHASLQDLEHAIHNAQEAIKEYKYLLYKENYQNCHEQHKHLENVLSKVGEEEEKASFKMTEEDNVLFKSDMAQLSALLGLKLDFLDGLKQIPPEHRNHRTLSDWIKFFLEENSESVVNADKTPITIKLLESIGFDPLSTAVETIMTRSAFVGSTTQHIEAVEWAQLFIEDEFKYNPLLSPLTSKFPFQSSLTNTWFQIPNEESNIESIHVNIMNLETKESETDAIQAKLSGLVPYDEQNTVLYHGTDHESAQNILVQGIYLYAGRQKRDFSCGKGFYLTNRMDDALNWGKSITTKPAILIFVVSRECLHKAQNLDLDGNQEKWREIVSSFRTDEVTATMLQSFSSYDLIEGPVATVTRNETELVFEPKPSSYQMCLISDSFAHEFQKSLHSAVFCDVLSLPESYW